MRSQLLFLLAVFIILSCQKDPGKLMAAKPITIFAAASTGPALQEIRTYLQMHEQLDLRIHVAASSLLAQQIRAGAPCDLVLLAETSWMIELAAQKKIVPASQMNLLSNRLVIISPLHQKIDLDYSNFSTLAQKVKGRFVIGDPKHVPVGKYAKSALLSMQAWQPLMSRFLYAPDARAALLWVELGEAGAGMIYWSDAISSKKVRIVTLIPESLHPPIRYPLAICKSGDGPKAKRVKDFLMGREAQIIFIRHGFMPSQSAAIERAR